jgi:hypothetical protein
MRSGVGSGLALAVLTLLAAALSSHQWLFTGCFHLSRFQTLDFLALDSLAHGRHLTSEMKNRLPDLIEAGAVESQGRGKGKRFFLSRELYAEMGSPGSYTQIHPAPPDRTPR